MERGWPTGRGETSRANQRWVKAAYGMTCLFVVAAVAGAAILLSDPIGGKPVAFPRVDPRTEAYRAYVNKDYARAKAIIDEQLKIFTDDHELKMVQIRVLLEMGRIVEAKKIADGFQKAKIEGAEILVALAELYRKMGYPDAAAAYLGKAMEIRKDDAYLWKELALLQHAEGRHMEALSSCQESLRLDPNQEDLKKLSSEVAMAMAQDPMRDTAKPGRYPKVDGFGPQMPRMPDPTKSVPRPEDYLHKPEGTQQR